VTSTPAPSVPADNPANAVTLLSTGTRSRSVSRIVAPRVVVANPVAKPCTARATTSAPAEPAVMNMSMATTFIAKALRMAGRRPMWSDSDPTVRSARRRHNT
jgi:hypothetical protein